MEYLMTTEPRTELLFRTEDATPISTDESTLKSWQEAQTSLDTASKVWLSTVRPDGRPHTMPVLLVWVDGASCFATRPSSRKGQNLATNPSSVIAVSTETLDLVVEGEAIRIREDAAATRIAAAFQEKYDWRFALRDGGIFDDNLPGNPEYCFYRVEPRRAFGYGPDGLTATRWRFS